MSFDEEILHTCIYRYNRNRPKSFSLTVHKACDTEKIIKDKTVYQNLKLSFMTDFFKNSLLYINSLMLMIFFHYSK